MVAGGHAQCANGRNTTNNYIVVVTTTISV
jgi:hypothetical protein